MLRRPRRVKQRNPVLRLPEGVSEVVWRATDARTGTVTEAVQRITVTLADPLVCCDVDGDGVIDRDDVARIDDAAGTPAPAGGAGDADGDGVVTPRDARECRAQCTRRRCA